MVRAKFYVSKVSELGYEGRRQEIMRPVDKTDDHPAGYMSTGVPMREVTMFASYDVSIAKENKSFADATPNGTMTFTLSNPALADEFKPGQAYYVEFTAVPADPPPDPPDPKKP